MRVFDLAWKDLRQLVRDWKAAIFLVAMPVVFTLMFGFIFGGFGGESDPRLPVGLLDRDGGGVLSTSLSDLLDRSEVIRPVALEQDIAVEEMEKRVQEEDLAAVVIVPNGYGARVLAGEIVALEVVLDENSNAGVTAQGEIQAVAGRLVGAVRGAQLSTQAYADQVGFSDEQDRQAFLEEALEGAVDAWADPPLTVVETESGTAEESGGWGGASSNAFTHSSPSMMVQFAIAGLMGAGEILVLERKSRALQRLLTTAISRLEIIVGHFLAVWAMAFLQLLLLVVFAQIALRVDYFRVPLGVLLVMVALSLLTASLGLLIGTVARSSEQVIIFSLFLMFILAGLGGAWMPLEFTSPTFQTVGHLLPSAWAMDGFENIVMRGLGLAAVLQPAGIVLAYAVVVFGLAVWRFRFE